MIKPTEHYEELRQGLKGYKYDEGYLTLKDCVAHILLDVRVWARSHGISPSAATDAYRLALELELCQLQQADRVMRRIEACLRRQPRSVNTCNQSHDPKLTGDGSEGRDKHHHEDGPGGEGYPLQQIGRY